MKFIKRNQIDSDRYHREVQRNVSIDRYDPDLPAAVGIEIEIEGFGCHGRAISLSSMRTSTSQVPWAHTEDGSLRGEAIEVRSRRPMDMRVLPVYMSMFQRQFGDFDQSQLSDRTSVHVHYNVTNMTTAEFHRIMTVAYLFEGLMVRRSAGPAREGNHFCLRSIDAEPHVRAIIEYLRNPTAETAWNVFRSENRYLNINTNSFHRFGTIEFRSHRGCTDANEIFRWCLALDEMMTVARDEFSSPAEIMQLYSAYGLEEFLLEYFPKLHAYLGSVLSHEQQQDFHMVSQRIAYAVSEDKQGLGKN